MTAWFLPLLCAAVLLAALVLVARPSRGGVQLAAAFLILGLVGYTWQGSPGLPGRPSQARAAPVLKDSLFERERKAFFETLGPEAQVLDTADAFIRNGDPDYAAGILRGALSRNPESGTLWVGYGHALTATAEGVMTPAARYAFDQGIARAPQNPAGRYFLALAMAEAGDLDQAEAIWTGLRPLAAKRSQWRALVEQKIAAVARLRTMMQDQP
ncbi:tetratricopeptide repeat protein [uncultured Sphingomonas sp.]|uniref:tetratricopeptide repeat protein n=1 Tax=uncultured Sphingomonas sp. TaxID=158754 RepID=UPI0025FD5BD7|nr:tetratricopeptide repeat protein [uncultured Sphingomonas sp.]